ncbi:uncharacterized protein [Rutidosis leptorrhynchoides]|uniref:uncharacterized protein n=1 Tax=Rutidosis leptorrhynchoides TaxID=125765 RepID=UPI003A998176
MSTLIDKNILGEFVGHGQTMIDKLIPKSIGIFVWQVIRGRLSVRLELDKRGVDLDSVRCSVSDNALESIEHILLGCTFPNEVWSRVCHWWCRNTLFILTDFPTTFSLDNGNNLMIQGNMVWQAVRWITGYQIWKNRNEKVFKNISKYSVEIFVIE